MTYPPFPSVLKIVVELFLPKNLGFARYRRFRVFGLHGYFDFIAVFFLGFGGDISPIFKCFESDGVIKFS